jgi:hypothetical protein
MAVQEGLRFDRATTEACAEARVAAHATRSAIEAPKMLISILVPSLTPAVGEAARAALALRGATDKAALDDDTGPGGPRRGLPGRSGYLAR